MTILSTMRTRIQREIRRTNIDTDIDAAINTAIAAYQTERWLFNESRSVTFSTVANQEFYTSSDHASLALVVKIDYVTILSGGSVFKLERITPEDGELSSNNATQTGQPTHWSWYNETLRLYPVPTSVMTVRVPGVYIAAAPASDSEASNPWMTTGERLIRSRAKLELAIHRLYDDVLATTMVEAVREAWTQLKGRTNQKTGSGMIAPMQF